MRIAIIALLLWFHQVPVSQTPVRPDFSGQWVLDDTGAYSGTGANLAAMLGERFTARQTEKSLTLDITAFGAKFDAVYNLDGSDSTVMSPLGPDGRLEAVISRATWEGDRLVIRTKATERVDGKDVPIESTRVMRIDAKGFLLLERSGTPPELVRTSLSVYRRAGK